MRRTPLILGAGLAVIACDLNAQGYLAAEKRGDLTYVPAPRARYDRSLSTACGAGGMTVAEGGALLRRPYLQQVEATSARVVWTSSASVHFDVRVSRPAGTDEEDAVLATPAAVDESATLPDAAQYVATISSLEPGESYCYEVLANGELWQRATGFRTAPAVGADASVAFVALGDLGARQPDQLAVRDQLFTVQADFAVITGDVAYTSGTLAELERNFFGVYRDWLKCVPVFPATGNHDYRCDDARPFREAFSLPENGGAEGRERWYSYDWGPVHVVVLDTERLETIQARWLAADLAATEQPWTVAVLHRPPYSSGKHGSDLAVRDLFGPIFREHQVPLVLAGHDHHYERTYPQHGVTYVVTGGGGRGTRGHGSSDFTAFAERVAHFLYVTVAGDALTLYAIDAVGEVFDTAQIRR